MRREILIAFLLGLLPVVAAIADQGDWQMLIHKDGRVDLHVLEDVDSLTIRKDTVTVSGMVRVLAGTFTMGDVDAHCGYDRRIVTLTWDFYLGRHLVTNAEFLEAVKWAHDEGLVTATYSAIRDNLDDGSEILIDLGNECCEILFDGTTFHLRESSSQWAQQAYPDGYDPSDHPVKMVSWFGAVRYCDWLSLQAGLPRAYEHEHPGTWLCNGGYPYSAVGYRLPTDAEWEYAARWNDGRIYPWGNEAPDCSRANYRPSGPGCVGWTSPVGDFPAGQTSLGLLDMAGNVSELCNDYYACNLGTSRVTNPLGPDSGEGRVSRGGFWSGTISDGLRCAHR